MSSRVRHPVEVPGNERAHLQQWLTRRCGWTVRAPELDATGLKLVGGRLLPGPTGPASFLMYESASGERFTLYTSRAKTGNRTDALSSAENSGSMYWSEDGVGYVLSGPVDKTRLNQVARLVYDQTEKNRRLRRDILAVPIRTSKIWNQVIGASHYSTARSREIESAHDPPIGASGLDWGLVPRWSPFRGRTPIEVSPI